ncbi:type I polyketide synthase [Streptomyces sp. AC154]|uniref:type I polyketide synthase n=1 Tax=Streptomyces sp. AC154 TaxID=3143184 RepID=UPI003F7FF41C
MVPEAGPVDLPTYAFQGKHYWLAPHEPTTDDLGSGPGHPLLTAVLELPGTDAVLLTGRVARQSAAWLADNVLGGRAVLPGTAFVELALRAADEAGCEQVGELTLLEPLVLPERGGVQLRVEAGEPGGDGRRAVSIHSRPDSEAKGMGWTCHATGVLEETAGDVVVAPDLAVWPPAGAESVAVDGVYPGLAEQGYGYGPGFRGLTALWRRGDEVYAEVALPERLRDSAAGFGLHPALLDAALHSVLATTDAASGGGIRLPFSWQGVTLRATGAQSLRVAVTPVTGDPDTVSLTVADPTGAPVATVDAITLRPVTAERVRQAGAAQRDALFRLDWLDAPAPRTPQAEPGTWAVVGGDDFKARSGLMKAGTYAEAYASLDELAARIESDGTARPDVVLLSGAPRADARHPAATVLQPLRTWLADSRFDGARLVVLTRGAVPVSGTPDPYAAEVWGLVRALQAEAPDRFVLADTDGSKAAWRSLITALAGAEPQLALRRGTAQVPRLVRERPVATAPVVDAGGTTALISGAGGPLGGLVARHLTEDHGVRDLLLLPAPGETDDGVRELAGHLAGLGARVTVAAQDPADPDALATLLDALPADRPLRTVIHVDEPGPRAVASELGPDLIDEVLTKRAETARTLHTVTAGREVSTFVLLAPAAGLLGGAGHAADATAAAFHDALAHTRTAGGDTAVALAYGPWTVDGAPAGPADPETVPMTADELLDQFDAACGLDRTTVIVARPAFDELTRRAATGDAPAPLRGLLGRPARRRAKESVADEGPTYKQRIAALDDTARDRALLDLVREHAAAVLGHATPDAIDPEQKFRELGFDSLLALALRNALNAVTGLRLQPGIVFDQPTPAELAHHLKQRILD